MDSNRFALTVLRHRFLGGPNVWTYRSTLEVWLDLGTLEQHPSHTIEGLTDRLLAWLPGLATHHCGVGEVGGFVQRLREGTWAGHVLEHCVIELLNLAGMPTGFGQTRSTSQPGVYRMVFRARNRATAEAALKQGHALLQAALNNETFDVPAAVKALHEVVDATWLGPSTAAIVNAATERGIPHLRLTEGNLVQLGHGAHQRRIWTAETDLTSAIAENIASDKDLTKTLLQSCGVPVPEGQIVASAAEAWEAAQDIGLPVVVKPSDANHGRGVSLELSEQADIERAFAIADAEGSDVIVERHILGNEHRVLVVGGRVVAANRGESLWVTGDGVTDVKTLIDLQLNSDPRRGEAEEFPLETIRLEREPAMALLLERQGLGADAVPAEGQRVLVQRNGNMAFDCTDEVHPEVAYMASLAARAVGLDIAGIDMVTQDIGRPLHEVGGAVVEVNAGPGLLMHLRPAIGQPRPVGEAIVAQLFDPATPMAGRVPLIGVSGTRGTALLTRAAAFLLDLGGAPAGLASSEGIHIGRRRIERAGADYWEQCQRLLMNREIQGLAVETAPSLILDHGLPYDRCLVGVVTDLGGWEGLSHHDIFEASGMPRVLRTQVDVVLEQGACVLNLDEPGVAALAAHCDGACLGYGAGPVPADIDMPRTVRWQDDAVCLIEKDEVVARAPLAGPVDAETASSLCGAAAAAWAAGLSPVLVAAGLQRFDTLPRA
ncbi:cyanophycin synthetase [Hydrogenophaga sp.]|uniref:cyanophycin synthetase family protein n=1 Tax=Hydrogenophaga sp. TaxID=1904254 RepID=UPI002735A8F3|nr:cyanophycin synthetase [Hydrogenophaga sp.]MDP2985694.1 cyanophycin synthetase [Hydrogenophaga sp.]